MEAGHSEAEDAEVPRIGIVTGASSGMGREFARALAADGSVDQLWLVARRTERLEALAGELPLSCRCLSVDLSDPIKLQEFDDLLARESPRVTFLVNCAGFGRMGAYDQISTHDADSMIDLNCRALVHLTRAALPHMPRGGRIIQLCSASAFLPLPSLNVYAATKAFVQSYTRALRWELHGRGITVTAVCPSWVKTEFLDGARKSNDATAVKSYPFAQKPQTVIRRGLRANRLHLAIATCGIPAFCMRIFGKFLPHCVTMAAWEGLRRL